MPLRIVDLASAGAGVQEATAHLLFEAFRARSDSWPDVDAARREVAESLEPTRISRVMLDDEGQIVGWVGGIPHYEGRAWELHPLVVAERHRRQGIGRALVRDLEALVTARGALTLWLGSDDETGETSLSGIDLYRDVPGAIRSIRNLGEHPYEFYTRIGFTVVGVLPDANGRGKPDIFLAKPAGV